MSQWIMRRGLLILAAAFVIAPSAARAQEPPVVQAAAPASFEDWLAELRTEALARGIRQEIVDSALTSIEPVAQILERDRTQAEFSLNLTAYLKRRLTRSTVRTAQQMYAQHKTLLASVGLKYGVQPRVITAVWGLESNFGRFAGVRPTIPALATLAYDQRRAQMFRNELFSALEIVNRGDIELERLRGSWAGALGQPQFMPSTYLKFSQDFDGDGRRDIWSSLADVFASIAFYLHEHGWTEQTTWGREVIVPKASRKAIASVPKRENGCRAERALTKPLPLKDWKKLGVRALGGGPLPTGPLPASLVTDGSRFFLVYQNYEAILAYNCATSYAISIGMLADRLK
ncbi:MAG TPA: lytic murein transglycosylase [Vicinamibacterales bacterium]